jgi:hypothetical protein
LNRRNAKNQPVSAKNSVKLKVVFWGFFFCLLIFSAVLVSMIGSAASSFLERREEVTINESEDGREEGRCGQPKRFFTDHKNIFFYETKTVYKLSSVYKTVEKN